MCVCECVYVCLCFVSYEVILISHLSPLFKGLGFVNFISQCFVGLYYNMIIAWTFYYFFASLTSELPWAGCNNNYNDEGMG